MKLPGTITINEQSNTASKNSVPKAKKAKKVQKKSSKKSNKKFTAYDRDKFIEAFDMLKDILISQRASAEMFYKDFRYRFSKWFGEDALIVKELDEYCKIKYYSERDVSRVARDLLERIDLYYPKKG